MASPRVALFVTCLVDMFRPSVGFATVKLLRDAGCVVEVPAAQTCCGQPAWNSGDRETAKAIARQVIAAFERYDYVVAPSGSCGADHRQGLSGDAGRRSGLGGRGPTALAARTFEITAFLADVLGVAGVAHGAAGGGHLSRQLLGPAQPRHRRSAAPAAGRRSRGWSCARWRSATSAAASAARSASSIPEISDVMVGDKTRNIAATGADLVLAGDLGCLMNMAGKASREGRRVPRAARGRGAGGRSRHAGDRRGRVSLHEPTTPAFKANAHAALGDANLQAALRGSRGNFVLKRAKARDALPEFDALRDRARDIKNAT